MLFSEEFRHHSSTPLYSKSGPYLAVFLMLSYTEATVFLHTILLGIDDISTFILLSWKTRLRVTCPLEKQGQVGQCTRWSQEFFRNTPPRSRKGSELSTAILDKAICFVDCQSVGRAVHVWCSDRPDELCTLRRLKNTVPPHIKETGHRAFLSIPNNWMFLIYFEMNVNIIEALLKRILCLKKKMLQTFL